jgi:hypothetical protein
LRAAGELGCPSPTPCLAPALPSFCVGPGSSVSVIRLVAIRSHAALDLRKCATPIPAVPLGASATKRPTANNAASFKTQGVLAPLLVGELDESK